MAVADQAGQADRSAVHQGNSPAAAVDTEDRVLGRHSQVTPGGDLETSGDGMALDCGDHRLREQHARRADGPVAVGLDAARAWSAILLHCLEVGAGAELAVRASEHGDGERLVGLEPAECVGERFGGGAVDRVGDIGSVDRDDDDRRVGLEVNRLGMNGHVMVSLLVRAHRKRPPPRRGFLVAGFQNERDFVDVAPRPVLARLQRADDRMAAGGDVLAGVLVRRGVTASDVATGTTDTQVEPGSADLQAVLAARHVFRRLNLYLVEVRADGHWRSFPSLGHSGSSPDAIVLI